METTAHINFIAASYAAAVIVIGGLIAWVTLDYRAQQRTLTELEMQGAGRGSGPMSPKRAIQPIKKPIKKQTKEQA